MSREERHTAARQRAKDKAAELRQGKPGPGGSTAGQPPASNEPRAVANGAANGGAKPAATTTTATAAGKPASTATRLQATEVANMDCAHHEMALMTSDCRTPRQLEAGCEEPDQDRQAVGEQVGHCRDLTIIWGLTILFAVPGLLVM